MSKIRAALNWLPHWAFVGGAMFAAALLHSLLGDSNLFAEIMVGNKAALWSDLQTALYVGGAALIGYLKTDPWSTADGKAEARKTPTVPTVPPGINVLFGLLLSGATLGFIGSTTVGCQQLQAAVPVLDQIEKIILVDIAAGKTSEEILKDVAAQVAGKPGVDVVVIAIDVLTALIDTGVISDQYLPKAQEHLVTFKAKHAAAVVK